MNQTRTLWLSIGSALFAVFLIYSYSQEKKAEYDKKYGATKRVVVAAKDILEISTIDDTMLEIVERPLDFVEPGAIENPEDAVGLVAANPIKKGEQLLSTKLLKPGPNTGLSHQVAPSKRAISLPVDEIRGVAKLVRPGDRIDLIAAIEAGSGVSRSYEVKTLLQDVIVLATGVNVTNNIPRSLEIDAANKANFKNLNGDTSFSSITIEVTPTEAQDLIFIMANSPGSLYMSLRNPNDRVKMAMPTASLDTVTGKPKFEFVAPRIPAAAPIVAAPVRAAPVQKKRPSGFIEVK